MKELQVLLVVLWRVTAKRDTLQEILKIDRDLDFPQFIQEELKLKSMIVHYVILRLCLSTTHLESVEIFETTRIVGSLSFWNNQRNPRHIQVVYDSYVLYFWVQSQKNLTTTFKLINRSLFNQYIHRYQKNTFRTSLFTCTKQ